jgi:putative transcriptional regulator
LVNRTVISIRRGVKRLNPVKLKILQIWRCPVFLALIIILALPAMLFVNLSSVSATLVQEIYGHASRIYARPVPDGKKAEKELAQGKFLVADRRLMDPNFRETVVLLIRYGPDGAMGLVINRPIQVKLSTVLPDVKELEQSKETLYLGGPVEPGGVLLLVRASKQPEDSMPVFGDVYLSSSREVLQRLIQNPEKDERFRLFAGYAGWASKQLEAECERGDWHVLAADVETLFDRKSSEIWPELIQRATVNWVHLKAPDPSGIQRFRERPNRPGTAVSLIKKTDEHRIAPWRETSNIENGILSISCPSCASW